MTRDPERAPTGVQVNFTLEPHWRLVLRLAAEADEVSVPDLLRPVVLRYLRHRLRDPDLAEAVARIESAKRSRRRVPDNVTDMPARPAKVQRGRQSTKSRGARRPD